MRDDDPDTKHSYRVIDTFKITVPFPSDNQEQVFNGSNSIASITLSFDKTCIDPAACNKAQSLSEFTGTSCNMYMTE